MSVIEDELSIDTTGLQPRLQDPVPGRVALPSESVARFHTRPDCAQWLKAPMKTVAMRDFGDGK